MIQLDSRIRKADELYSLIEDGDRIAVGLSGGKDSTALLWALAKLKSYCGKDFSLIGISIDPQFYGKPTDFSPLTEFCEKIGVQHIVHRDNIYDVVFEIKKENNPCSLCARLRRGSLNRIAKENGCNKLALGHHMDDVAATFWLNFVHEGRVASFAPKTYLDRSDITLIRPLVLIREQEIEAAVSQLEIPVIQSGCPVNGSTERAKMEQLMARLEDISPDMALKTFSALQKSDISGYGVKI